MDLMLDLETLDTKPGATILSIGAVLFNRETTWSKGRGTFYVEVNVDSQLPYHTTASADTIKFWSEQPIEAQLFLTDEYQREKTTPIASALNQLDEWVKWHLAEGTTIDAVWSQGQDFDFPILAELYRRVREGKPNNTLPWPFWAQRDTRTIYDVTGFDLSTVERTGKKHNALADCHHQIKCLWLALNKVRLFSKLDPEQVERLVMLMEEAGEVVQAASKIIRHGYSSYHPDRTGNNRDDLSHEVKDFIAVASALGAKEEIDLKDADGPYSENGSKRWDKKLKFTHHQRSVP